MKVKEKKIARPGRAARTRGRFARTDAGFMVTGLVTLLSISLPAVAQTAPAARTQASVADSNDISVPDVVVTSERRETQLQSTPTAVNAISEEEIEKRGIRTLNDLAGIAAGLHAPASSTASTEPFFIRGIGTSRANGNPSVGVYLDDVYIARPFGISYYGSLPDLKGIEILHGPQGTLYGQNTSAGAIKLISNVPTDEKKAWLSTGVGNQGAVEVRGYASGPIAPGLLAASVAYSHTQNDGDLQDNGRGGKSAAVVKVDQLRTIFRLTPDASFAATLAIDGMKYDEDYVLAPDRRYVAGAQERTTFTTFYETPHYDGGGVSLKLDKRLDQNLSVKSITAWRGYTTPMATDWGTLPGQVRVYGFGQTLRERQISQEFQFAGDYDRFNFITGVSLFRETFDVDRLTWTNNTYTTLHSSSTSDTAGVFGQASYKLTDALTLTGGLRFSRERKQMDASSYNSNAAAADLGTIYKVDGLSKTYSGTTPKLSLAYAIAPTVLSYLSWSKGQTSGGYNPAAATLAIAGVPVDTEKVTAYELGFKDSSWNGRLKTNVALFYNDYRGYQASVSNPVINGQTVPGGVVVNAGNAHTFGVELDTVLKATRRLDASLSVALLRAKFDQFLNPTGVAGADMSGQDLPKAPHMTLGASLTYGLPVGDSGLLRLTGAFRYESASYSDISATRELTKYPSQNYLDVGASHVIGAWTTSLTVKNVLNKTYVLPGLYSPTRNIYDVTYNPSRTFLLSLRRDFS